MANAVDDALNRGSAEQRERAMQTIEEARRNIQMNNVQMGDISLVPSTEAENGLEMHSFKASVFSTIFFHAENQSNELFDPALTFFNALYNKYHL